MKTQFFIAALLALMVSLDLWAFDTGEHSREKALSVHVSEVDTGDFILPEGSLDFIKPQFEQVLSALCDIEIQREIEGAGVKVIISLTGYNLKRDEKIGYVALVDLEVLFEGESQSRCGMKSLGEGDTAYSAVYRAAEDLQRQFGFCLQSTALWGSTLRVIDIAAGRAILNRGSSEGVRLGEEFFFKGAEQQESLLKVSAVFEDFSEAYILMKPDVIRYGQVLSSLNRAGMKTSLTGRYDLILPKDNIVSEGTWSVLSRTFFERGLFALSPFLGLEYIQNRCSCVQFGAGLNWYFGPLLIVPAIGGQIGYGDGESGPPYWGGFSEIAVHWNLNRLLVLYGDVGLSTLYSAENALKDFQFIFSGLGIMLKY